MTSILLVEDSRRSRNLAERTVVSLGYTVSSVSDAASALHLIESGETVDLLFTDIRMPGEMDGLQLARIVRERYPTMPILLTSGFALPEDTTIAGVSVLAKPYRKAELAAKLAELTAPNQEARGGQCPI